jgi:hypothetical protein
MLPPAANNWATPVLMHRGGLPSLDPKTTPASCFAVVVGFPKMVLLCRHCECFSP